jgi:hypothetical protein
VDPVAPDDSLRRTAAYHEASHAAVGVRLGFRLTRVAVLDDDPDDCGLCQFDRAAWEEALAAAAGGDRGPIGRCVMVSLAGWAGARRAGVGGNSGAGDDYERAYELASHARAGGEGAEGMVSELASRVEAVLAEPGVWAGVERLAAELLRVKSLSGDEAHRILAGLDQTPAPRGTGG